MRRQEAPSRSVVGRRRSNESGGNLKCRETLLNSSIRLQVLVQGEAVPPHFQLTDVLPRRRRWRWRRGSGVCVTFLSGFFNSSRCVCSEPLIRPAPAQAGSLFAHSDDARTMAAAFERPRRFFLLAARSLERRGEETKSRRTGAERR